MLLNITILFFIAVINSFVSFRKDSEYCPNIQVFNYIFNILCNYIIIYTNKRLNNA
ncbi:hypothetical protein BACFIN_05631 [Bacteroides finegoldii DSM 17565]|nr:hypothetical protein BACFIN_05631 [Bacteroides finegoldii DSM 17565]